MSPVYDHKCEECGPVLVETDTIAEYLEFKEEYGTAKGGSVQVPCPSCGEMAARDYSAGTPSVKIKGGRLYKTFQYAKEVAVSKEVLKFNKGTNPYAHMSADPEKLRLDTGERAVRVSDATARERARGAQNTLGATKEKVNANIARSKL